MTVPFSKPSYTGARVGGRDSAHASDTSVELQLLHDKKIVEEDSHNTKDTHSKRRPTKVPLQGPAALLSVVLLTGAAVGVLLASRGSPISRWKVQNVQIQPQVWLSVLSIIMDGLTMFAAAKAAEITFWRSVAHGTTLRSMYDLYESQSVLGALKNLFRRRGDKLAVVSVLCLVSALRGPLFQRASIIDSNAMRITTGKQEFKVAQLVPPNFLFDEALFDDVYNLYLERAPIHINVTSNEEQCGDHCEGKVQGYGFDIQCSEVSYIPWDNSSDSTVRQMYQDSGQPGSAVPAFNSSAILPGGMDDSPYDPSDQMLKGGEAQKAADLRGWFNITNLFKNEAICGGDLSLHKCSLHHAVVEYDVTLSSNGIVSLRNENWQDDKVLFQTPSWNLPTGFSDTFDSLADPWGPTIHWVAWFMAEFNQEIDTIYSGGEGDPFAGENYRMLLAKRFINGNINNISCSTTFRDPTQFVLNRLHEMAFRTAVAAAALTDPVLLFGNAKLASQDVSLAQNWTQNVDVTGQRHFTAYTVSIPYLVCAVVCSLLAVAAILPLYWNARGDIVILRSFNPLDVAHLFDAPLLQDVYEADIGNYVRKEEGLKRVRCSTKAKEWESRVDTGLMRVVPEG